MPSHTLFKYVLPLTAVLIALTFQATATVGQTAQNGSAAAVTNESPVGPKITVPAKSLPPGARVGIDASAPVPLTLQEAISLALENNNDIATSRIDVELSEHDLNAARGAYDPVLTSQSNFEHSRVPVSSFFGGTTGDSLKQTDITSRLTLNGLSPRAGGSYQFGVTSTRLSSNNFFNDLNPSYSTGFSISYTQPLLRGRRIDDTRRRIEIAKRNLSLTDVQFRQRATEVITRVEEAYWQLVYALKNLQVQNEAVNQSKAQVETNRRQVAQGVLAPIDVVEAEAQVKNFEQNVYAAQEDVTRAENALKGLLLPNRGADLWSRALLPVTAVDLQAPRLVLDEAITVALANRLELAELRTSREINDINKSFYRDQTKPQIDVTVGYSSNGLAGTFNNRDDNPVLTGISSLEKRVAELSNIAGLPALPATSFSSVSADLRGGYGTSLKNLLSQENPTVRFGVTISLPLRNRTAKAQLAHSSAEERRLDVVKTKAEQTIEADVRNAMQAVQSVKARMTAAAASRTAAEQQFESERRKFQAGMSTVFLVLQRQTDLVTARGRELQAQTDLNKAIAELHRAMGNTLSYRNVSVNTEGYKLQQGTASAEPIGGDHARNDN
jgi:outer membrane protein TolC